MGENNKLERKLYNKDIIYGVFLILILIGKVVRYTIMKEVLVDTSIGHYFIDPILYGSFKIVFLDIDTMASYAGGNAIALFKMINIFKLSTYIGWEVYITIIWNIILLVIISKMKKKLSLIQISFVMISIMVLNLFDFNLAKEPVQMLYFIAIYAVINSKLKDRNKYIATYLILIFTFFTFRSYYVLVLMFMLYVVFVFNKIIIPKNKITKKDIIFIIISLGVLYFMCLNFMKLFKPDQYAELIRVRTRTSNAASDMRNIFKSSNLVIFTVDYLIMLFRMMFPVELLRLGVKYIPYVMYQFIISGIILKSMLNIKKIKPNQRIALYVYIGFLFASATFEPDFGSWVRHEAVTFPIMCIIADLFGGNDEKING